MSACVWGGAFTTPRHLRNVWVCVCGGWGGVCVYVCGGVMVWRITQSRLQTHIGVIFTFITDTISFSHARNKVELITLNTRSQQSTVAYFYDDNFLFEMFTQGRSKTHFWAHGVLVLAHARAQETLHVRFSSKMLFSGGGDRGVGVGG